MRRNPARVGLVAAAALVVFSWGGFAALRSSSYGRSASLVVRAAGLSESFPRVAGWHRQAVRVTRLTIPARHGAVPARVYRPEGGFSNTVLLVPGIHALGVHEPRLESFAGAMAETGLLVVTAAMPDMTRYRVTSDTADTVEDVALAIANDPGLAPDGRIGMAGISFAGGLSIVAAGRPALRHRVSFVFAFGAHASFREVLRYSCTGVVPAPFSALGPPAVPAAGVAGHLWRKPHDYGVAVFALDAAERLVPEEQVEPLRKAIMEFLGASHVWVTDPEGAEHRFQAARVLAGALPEPAASIMREVNGRDVAALGARLLPFIEERATADALSPIDSPPPAAPVYLLHGVTDNLVPPEQASSLERYLEGKTRTRVLLTSLVDHAELARRPTAVEAWGIVSFIAGMLRER
jgi:hypothetical protein